MMRQNVVFFSLLFFATSSLAQNDQQRLANAAVQLTTVRVAYDPSYFVIPYPNGDVPSDRGVCTDVIIRAYRKLGIDLQQKVHEDMVASFLEYPNAWGLTKTDSNIDHRRVPNLMRFFSRHGTSLASNTSAVDYKPGDIVAWSLGKGVHHIGIVINRTSRDGKRPLVVHNIGNGQEISDCLFSYPILGHYRYPAL